MTTSDPFPINNRYRLHEPIGSGGMGEVYRAYDRLERSWVALKRIRLNDPGLRQSFADTGQAVENVRLSLTSEFQTLAALRHPQIIRVLDYGFDRELQPYFTMDYLERAQDIFQAGRHLPLAGQVELLQQVLRALAYLHRNAILHRDLKPANVLVCDGQVRLLDFGLASQLSAQPSIAGTPAYMAPELLTGAPASPASDLYSVGVIAYELLAGKLPFAANDLIAMLSQSPDLSFLDGMPALQDLLRRLLAKNPQDRPQDAEASLEALRQALGLPNPPQPPAERESFLRAARFIGRQSEMGVLSQALDQTLSGRGGIWLVGGESGVGKTRLLNELRIQALVRGARVVRGYAVDDPHRPYHAWREPLRLSMLEGQVDASEAGLLQTIAPDLPELAGEAYTGERAVREVPPMPPHVFQRRLHEHIARAVQSLPRSGQPVVVLLDDLHWAYGGLRPLRHLWPAIAGLPLLIVGCFRSDERPDLPHELPEAEHLELGRLLPEAVAELSVSMLGPAGADPALLERLLRETEGNVYFLVETLRALAEESGGLEGIGANPLPERIFAGGVEQLVQRRLDRVPPAQRRPLKLAALAGRELDLKVLRLADPSVKWDDWLEICNRAGVLAYEEGAWAFAHDKLRELLRKRLGGRERKEMVNQLEQAYARVYPGMRVSF